MGDFIDLMRQLGYQVLPKPALREGFMLPPAAMDGIPAPISRLVKPEDTVISQAIIETILTEDFETGDGPSALWSDEMVWYGGAGFGMATTKQEYETQVLVRGLAVECWAMFDLPAAFNMIGVNLFDRM